MTHIFNNAHRVDGYRRITFIYDDPREADAAGAPYGESGWHARIKLTIEHNKDYKRFEARISRCMATVRETAGTVYGVEHVSDVLGSGWSTRFMTEPVARYSAAQLERFAAGALDFCAAVMAGSNCGDATPLLGELLALADAFTTEKELLAR